MDGIIEKLKGLLVPSIGYKIGIPVVAGFLLFGYLIYSATNSEMNKLVVEEFEERIVSAAEELAGSAALDLYELEEKRKELERIQELRKRNRTAVPSKPFRLNKDIDESIKRAVESTAKRKDIYYALIVKDLSLIHI